MQDSPSGDNVATEFGPPLPGSTYGGRQPISGAHLYMFAANETGYGAPSISLITNFSGGSFPSTVDSNGNFYITTSSTGGFLLASGEYACTPGQQVYLYSVAGNPGTGPNTGAALLAVLGTCQSGGTFSAVGNSVNLNEISTIAAAYALSGFATDALHVASSSTALSITGLTNAFNNAADMYNISAGSSAGALSATPNGNGVVPQTELNSLANILAACVNSSGPQSGACAPLFANARNHGSSGALPADTATAAINIAHNPGNAVSTLFAIPAGVVPWAPALSASPNDFTVAITFTDTSLSNPYGLAIDASGNAWITNSAAGKSSCVTEFSPRGVLLSPANIGYYTTNMDGPFGIAIDNSGNAWMADRSKLLIEISPGETFFNEYKGSALTGTSNLGIAIDPYNNLWIAQGSAVGVEFSNSGNQLLTTYGGGMAGATSVASDLYGNMFFANADISSNGRARTYGSVSVFNNAGTPQTTGTNGYGYTLLQLDSAAIAIDSSGNFWTPNAGSNTVTELSDLGRPVNSPGYYQGSGLSQPAAIAFDGNSYAWIANNTGSVSEFTSSGIAAAGGNGIAGGLSGTALSGIQSIAVDGSGNVWVANYDAGSVTEILGVATPVVTPIVANLHAPYNKPASMP